MAVKHQVAQYGWIEGKDFISRLEKDLETAHRCIKANDSLACAVAVKSFQGKIDLAYQDPHTTNTCKMTIEGWKVLHYDAQYILDRLPTGQ